MAERKDYYKILGVEKTASDEEIKSAYKKLALKYHPDRFAAKSEKEQKEAEEKFKEVNESYQVLSNKEKRNQYDNPNPFGSGNPFDGFNPFGGGGNPFGFDFEDLFGGRNKKKYHQRVKGSNIKITLQVTLEDILGKVTKHIKYKRQNGSSGKSCSHCGGTGEMFEQKGSMQFIHPCPYCNGSGLETVTEEHECEFVINGVDESNDVNFNPDTNTATFVQVIKGEGNVVSSNKSDNGDLIAIISFKLPNGYRLETPTDVGFEMEVPILTAILGGEVEVKTLDGSVVKAKIPQGVENGTKMRFGGKGLHSNNKVGNLFGYVKFKMPKNLSNNEKNILSQLVNSENFK